MTNTRKTATVLRPVPRASTRRENRHTVDALRTLLEHGEKGHAERGRLSGLAFLAIYENQTFVVDATDEAYRVPDVTRGYLTQLHDALGKLSRGEEVPSGW